MFDAIEAGNKGKRGLAQPRIYRFEIDEKES
jgi:hypothetical protein